MKPRFSIIIPTLNNPSGLRRLLKSLKLAQGIRESEIILVKNPPDSEFVRLMDEFPDFNIKILFCEKGVNRARNLGLLNASGSLILFLDDDCWVSDPQLLEKHESSHVQNPWAFAVGGHYQNISTSEICKAYSRIQESWLQSTRLNLSGECRALLGGHFSIKSSASPQLFKESIIYGGSETEYFLRLHTLGYRFLLKNFSVVHEPELKLFSFMKKAYRQGKTHRQLQMVYGDLSFLRNYSRSSKYQNVYDLFFHLKIGPFIMKPLLKIRTAIKNLHHDLMFYLSQQNLF